MCVASRAIRTDRDLLCVTSRAIRTDRGLLCVASPAISTNSMLEHNEITLHNKEGHFLPSLKSFIDKYTTLPLDISIYLT